VVAVIISVIIYRPSSLFNHLILNVFLESLGLKITEAGDSPFLHLTENGKTITIDEDGLYMMTLIMTATTFKKYSDTASKYYTFMSCLKFVKNVSFR
jgi:hypothetical protein